MNDEEPLLILNEWHARTILLLIIESNNRTVGVLDLEHKAMEFLDNIE